MMPNLTTDAADPTIPLRSSYAHLKTTAAKVSSNQSVIILNHSPFVKLRAGGGGGKVIVANYLREYIIYLATTALSTRYL
jgi:hypothetical protein